MTYVKPNMQHGRFTQWNWIPLYPEGIHIGNNVDIGAFCLLDGKNELYIGDNVQIGSHCSIYTHSTIDKKHGGVVIRDNAKIGSHCTIMPSITIGFHSTVAAHSFVDKDIPDGELWGDKSRMIQKLRARRDDLDYWNFNFSDGTVRLPGRERGGSTPSKVA